MKYIFIILLLITSALAQNRTIVTAIVKDSNGTVYQNCSYSVDWVNQSNLSVLPSFGGGNFQTSYSGARCDSSGNLSIQLPSNLVITPQPNKWRFGICSVAGLSGGPYCFQTTLTISGATQDISAALTSVAALLPPIGAGGGSLNGLVNRIVKFGTLTSGVNSSLTDDTTTVSTPENFSIGGTLNVTGASTLGTVGTGNNTAQSLVAATGGANQSSPLTGVSGNYWNGAASATDLYTWQDVLGTGTNPSAILTLAHTGSTGLSGIQFPVLGMGLGAGSVPGGGSVLVATSGPAVISQLDLEAPTVTENTNPYHNLALGLNVKPSANSAQNYSLQKLVVQVDPTNTSTINDANNFVKGNVIDVFGGGSGATRLRGIDLYVNQQGTSTNSTAGNRFEVQPAAGTVNLTSNVGLELWTGGAGTWTGTTNLDAGLYIDSPQVPTGSTLSTHYGIYIEDQSLGGAGNVNPFALAVAGGRSVFQGTLESITPGTVNFTTSAHTSPIKSGTTAARPATCTFTAGVAMETYLETDATAGQNLDFCTATNTWTRMSGGGGNPVWSTIQNPAGNLALNMGTNTTAWTFGNTTTSVPFTMTFGGLTGSPNVNQFQIADSVNSTNTGYLQSIASAAGSTAKGLSITTQGTSGLNLQCGNTTCYNITTPTNDGIFQFSRLESNSAGHALSGSKRMAALDPEKRRDPNRPGGAVDQIDLLGILYSGTPGAPLPFAAGTILQVGDVNGIAPGGPITTPTAGSSLTIQPFPQNAGNANGGAVNINGGVASGTGTPGNVTIGGTGVVNFNVPIAFPFVNSPTNATVINDLVCYDPANPGKVMACTAGSSSGVQGVCIQNCGTAGSAIVVVAGATNLNLDNSGIAGDYVCISPVTNGFGTDCGTNPSSGQTVANVQSAVSGTLFSVEVNPGSPNPSSVLGNAVVINPASSAANTIQGTGSTVVSLTVKSPVGAASTLCALQVLANTGASLLCDQQGGTLQVGTGVTGSVTATNFNGPNANPATAGVLNGSDTDLLVAWRNHANSANLGFSKNTSDTVSLNTNFSVTGTVTATNVGPLTGDVNTTNLAATVVGLQTMGINTTVPTVVGQRLEFNGTQWAPAGPGFSATNLTSGTIPDARLSTNVPLLNASNTFTGATQTFGSGNGGAITTGQINSVSIECSPQSYVICGSAVDANGHPSYITQGTCGATCALTINGAGFLAYIQGIYQIGTGTYTNAITGLAASTFQYVYLKLDTANANLAAADFAATILAPVYSYKAPTACTGAAAGAPQYWFDLSTTQWKVSTAAACSFSVASPQVVFLGVGRLSSTPALLAFLHEPFFLDPYQRFKQFGDGFDTIAQAGTDITKIQITSGTTTVDNQHTYTAFEVLGTGIVTPTAFATSGATQGMAIIYSQNPIIVSGASASVNANGLGRLGGALATNACNTGNAAGFAGAGGGGGGASATNAGCNGGNRTMLGSLTTGGQGTGGAIATIGNNATSTPTAVPLLASPFTGLIGAGGGSGGGDGGGSSGGSGGTGGGFILVRAPSVLIDATATLSADAGAAVAGAGTNGGGGGGGGGGTAACQAYFCIISGTNTANGSNGAAGLGGGKAGGNGTNGIVQNWNMR